MSGPNWKNRTLFHGDNLDIMRGMNSASVDLIYLDPPFNKSKDFHATPDSLAKGAKFQDRWSWEKDVQGEWADLIKDDLPSLMEAIESARYAHSDGMGAYMCFMAVRLMEMKRLLKDTGSIYLHCDPTASHYLKAMLDAVFGWRKFRNEIIWVYGLGGSSKRYFSQKHDCVLFYSKASDYIFHKPQVPATSQRMKGQMKGMLDTWTDIPSLNNQAKERYGYPTQKPLALLDRIIKASSNEGDIVLDPFCGCATTCVAAERLKRRWVGVDIWDGSKDAVTTRMHYEGLMSDEHEAKNVRAALKFGDVHFKTDPPERTDEGEFAGPGFQVQERRRHQKMPWERLTHKQITAELIDAQSGGQDGVVCAGCGRRMEKEFMELDHITPRKDNGANDISNRILLCGPCNRRKRHNLTLSGLRNRNRKEEWMQNQRASEQAQAMARARYELIRIEGGPVSEQTELMLD